MSSLQIHITLVALIIVGFCFSHLKIPCKFMLLRGGTEITLLSQIGPAQYFSEKGDLNIYRMSQTVNFSPAVWLMG